jgi:NAD(P)H-nitrite reductase large subunit
MTRRLVIIGNGMAATRLVQRWLSATRAVCHYRRRRRAAPGL